MIRIYLLFALLLMAWPMHLSAQPDPPAYRLFDSQGRPVSWKRLLAATKSADVVFFGELHDNPVCHWLQAELLRHFLQTRPSVTLGLEMFERDQQPTLDSVLKARIPVAKIPLHTRTWPNFTSDYLPLLELLMAHPANQRGLVATNVPRTYASKLFRGGWEAFKSLPDNEKAWMAALPIPIDYSLPQYQSMLKMAADMHAGSDTNFVNAQALKDATMAESIARSLPAQGVFYHLNGAFHTDYHEGILWYLQRLKPGLKVVTISTVVGESGLSSLPEAERGRADFILVTQPALAQRRAAGGE